MRIKELRNERNMTQSEVAEAIHTSQRNIGRWENNEVLPTSEFIIRLADFFQVTTDYLLGRSDDFGNIAIEKNAPQLTAEEQLIINQYRTLPEKLKQLVRQQLDTFASPNEITTKN